MTLPDLDYLDHELTEMKAMTLSMLGKKVEMAIEMLKTEKAVNKRLKGILERAKTKEKSSRWWKKKKYTLTIERVEKKLGKSNSKIRSLKNLREQYKQEYINQREALGLMEHSFVEDFFRSMD